MKNSFLKIQMIINKGSRLSESVLIVNLEGNREGYCYGGRKGNTHAASDL